MNVTITVRVPLCSLQIVQGRRLILGVFFVKWHQTLKCLMGSHKCGIILLAKHYVHIAPQNLIPQTKVTRFH